MSDTLAATETLAGPRAKSRLDRALSVFADVQGGEAGTALLLMLNVFLLLISYSVIKTVREPLILLGGGAEVRSYAAAGQALLLMAFVPAYAWFASKVGRAKLLVGVTLFFIACIEVFTAAIAARVPYVGVAFFIWVGIFNMSLVAQFWSFATDLYSEEAGSRLFPIVAVGMTAGAPLGSLVAARLFRSGMEPQVILQVSALLLVASLGLYLWINRRAERTELSMAAVEPLSAEGGFRLVLESPRLRLIALLIVLLNLVNTTGEYLVARLLSSHVASLAAADPLFDPQAYVGDFSGTYQFGVNVLAFLLQAFVASRLVKRAGLAGALLALPIIALGGYALIAAGVGFAAVRWVKTLENATDYSVMNTARQLLWLPMTREEKYKAKQAIDTFFVRSGDLLSAGVVYVGTTIMTLTPQQFAMANTVLTMGWLLVAVALLNPGAFTFPRTTARQAFRAARHSMSLAGLFALTMTVLLGATPALAQDASEAPETRAAQLAAARASKAAQLHPYSSSTLERRLALVDRALSARHPVYLAMGSSFDGAGVAFGPGYRLRFGDTGAFDARATYSMRGYRSVDARVALPEMAGGRVAVEVHGHWLDAPGVAFFGVGAGTTRADRTRFDYRTGTVGATASFTPARHLSLGASLDALQTEGTRELLGSDGVPLRSTIDPRYVRTAATVAFDTRTSPDYSRRGGLYRVEFADYHQVGGGGRGFQRLDAELQRYVPVLREHAVLAFRAAASSTMTGDDGEVPYYLMPDLGGSTTLRGFSPWRFRDRNRLLLTGEYRWAATSLLDMAVFVDAGTVSGRRDDLDLHRLAVSPGLGLRIHTPSATVTRLELARSREGLRAIVSFGPSF